MFLDYALLILVSLIGVGLTVVGGFVASEKPWVRIMFLVGGPLLVICIIWQGVRQIGGQSTADAAFMDEVRARKEERRLSDSKIDGLYALLQPRVKELPAPPLIASTGKPPKTSTSVQQTQPTSPKPLLPPNAGTLSITQSSKISTRADAPYETEVVVQTSVTFQSLKFAMACDGPLVDAHPTIGGAGGMVQMVVSSGILTEHPNVFVYSYGSSTPPFSPSNPLIIDVWSKDPVKCAQVATF